MEILELTEIKDRLIGDPDTLGLSPGQLKRVTIGVELVANPSILFLSVCLLLFVLLTCL